MKTFKINGDAKHLYLQNFERIEEELVYEEVKEKLSRHKGVVIEDMVQAPYCDMNTGHYKDKEFALVLDFSEGVFLHSDDGDCLDALELILND